jgi:hypothetical protein
MMPTYTTNLLSQFVVAALNDSAGILRRAEMTRAEKSIQGGLHGPIAVKAHILTLYEEYKRRAEIILNCIQRVLRESSFRYYKNLDNDLQEFFLNQCSACSVDIEAKLRNMPAGGKPTFPDFKTELHQKLLAELSLDAENYLAHHKEVVRPWWVAHGKTFFGWLIVSTGTIIISLLIAWLKKKYI